MITAGSNWHRWEPHIHAPGTVLNNQFGGEDPWDAYLTEIETKSPRIRALAVTDYYLTDLYEQVLQHKESGRLADVDLIFPNVEMRLDVAAKSGFINVHLLVSPEDPKHLAELKRFLSRLHFRAHKDRFDCTQEDLIRLGNAANPSLGNTNLALREGATQFKVNFSNLREVYGETAWANENILIAVAGGSDDGTSGIRHSADAVLRQEIESFAHVIFASSNAQREFWLGLRGKSTSELRERYGGLKPCLHGSDAHSRESVGEAFDERYSWVKGALIFDSLRQACIDPGGRVYIGPQPPASAMPSQVISSVKVENADWAGTAEIPLNSGLVTIIGARGSGKTALAEMIATGCDAVPNVVWEDNINLSSSFLSRAKDLLEEAKVRLTWAGGDQVTRALDGRDADGSTAFPRARYLSQQFVEDLCSAAHGPADALIAEIERVIHQAHEEDSLDGALDFTELRENRTQRFRQARAREAAAIETISQRISEEHEKERLVPSLVQQIQRKTELVAGYKADLSKLVIKGSEAQIKRHGELQVLAQEKRAEIEAFKAQRRAFEGLQDEVASTRATTAPEMLRQTKARYPMSGLDEQKWEEFLLDYKGQVDTSLAGYIRWADKNIMQLTGVVPAPLLPGSSLIPEGADLNNLALAVLTAEIVRLEGLLKADQLVRNQYATLSQKITREERELQTLKTRLSDHQGAAERRRTLHRERVDAYERVFDAIVAEEAELAALYSPLEQRLEAASSTLGKLQFSVRRTADAAGWAEFAEEALIDRRQAGDGLLYRKIPK